jgi:hypothetical protein
VQDVLAHLAGRDAAADLVAHRGGACSVNAANANEPAPARPAAP